jgi:type I restriction enzyme R subunit
MTNTGLCAARYKALDEDEQVEFKAAAKDFVRLYNFLGAILSYGMPDWEKELLKYVELDSYRAEKKGTLDISLDNNNYELSPISIGAGFAKETQDDYLVFNGTYKREETKL